VNDTERDVPFTRIAEHKHFEGLALLPHSVITREYPADYHEGGSPADSSGRRTCPWRSSTRRG